MKIWAARRLQTRYKNPGPRVLNSITLPTFFSLETFQSVVHKPSMAGQLKDWEKEEVGTFKIYENSDLEFRPHPLLHGMSISKRNPYIFPLEPPLNQILPNLGTNPKFTAQKLLAEYIKSNTFPNKLNLVRRRTKRQSISTKPNTIQQRYTRV